MSWASPRTAARRMEAWASGAQGNCEGGRMHTHQRYVTMFDQRHENSEGTRVLDRLVYSPPFGSSRVELAARVASRVESSWTRGGSGRVESSSALTRSNHRLTRCPSRRSSQPSFAVTMATLACAMRHDQLLNCARALVAGATASAILTLTGASAGSSRVESSPTRGKKMSSVELTHGEYTAIKPAPAARVEPFDSIARSLEVSHLSLARSRRPNFMA